MASWLEAVFVGGIKPGERCLNKPTQLYVETANGFRALPCTGNLMFWGRSSFSKQKWSSFVP